MIDRPSPLGVHLDELRQRVFRVLLSVLLFSGAAFYFAKDLIWILKWPASAQIKTLAVFSPTAAILSYLKVALAFGLIGSLPVLLYETWMFLLPALDPRHIRSGFLFIFFGTALFISGAAFNFFILIPASIRFLLGLGQGDLQFIISLESYISFVLLFLLAGGFVFEIPILVFFLSKYGVITAEKAIKGWRVAILVILLAAGILTPTPDAVNMLLMALPMFVLYFVCIGIARFVEKDK